MILLIKQSTSASMARVSPTERWGDHFTREGTDGAGCGYKLKAILLNTAGSNLFFHRLLQFVSMTPQLLARTYFYLTNTTRKTPEAPKSNVLMT